MFIMINRKEMVLKRYYLDTQEYFNLTSDPERNPKLLLNISFPIVSLIVIIMMMIMIQLLFYYRWQNLCLYFFCPFFLIEFAYMGLHVSVTNIFYP